MIGNGVSVNRMYSVTRRRETIYGDYIFKYHPDFAGTPRYYTAILRSGIEGGDILNINDHVLLINSRSARSPMPSMPLRRGLFASTIDHRHRSGVRYSKSRAFMHLDTVFTQVDYDKFTDHPGILGPLTVFEITPDGKGDIRIGDGFRFWKASWRSTWVIR